MPGAEGGCRWRRIVVAGAFAALAWSTVYAKPSTYYVKEANQYTHKEISRPLKSNCATRSAKRRKIPFCEHVWLRRICSSATPNWPSARRAPRGSTMATRRITCPCWQTPCSGKKSLPI